MRILPLSIALAGLLVGASAAPASTPPAPRACFDVKSVNNWRLADDDDRTVYLRVGASRVFRLDLVASCPDLDFGQRMALQTFAGVSRVCEGLGLTLIAPSSIGPQRCPVRAMRQLSVEEIAALPPRDKP